MSSDRVSTACGIGKYSECPDPTGQGGPWMLGLQHQKAEFCKMIVEAKKNIGCTRERNSMNFFQHHTISLECVFLENFDIQNMIQFPS